MKAFGKPLQPGDEGYLCQCSNCMQNRIDAESVERFRVSGGTLELLGVRPCLRPTGKERAQTRVTVR